MTSCVNPIIYALTSEIFRNAYKQLLFHSMDVASNLSETISQTMSDSQTSNDVTDHKYYEIADTVNQKPQFIYRNNRKYRLIERSID